MIRENCRTHLKRSILWCRTMKCWSILFFLAGFFGISLTAETILELPFRAAEEIKAWRGAGNAEFVRDGNDTVLHIRHDGRTRNSFGISRPISPERIAGRRITCSAEVKRDLAVHRKWQGAKLIITVRRKNGDQGYYGVYMEPGKFDWTKVGRTFDIPQDITSAALFIGIQNGTGEVFYKNLKITADDLMLDLAPFANMGYADEKSGDGKGGWSDQGPDNDASDFDWKKGTYANVPFQLIDPGRNGGKSVLTFRNKRFPQGLESVTVDVANRGCTGKYLYLFSTLTFPDNYPPVGEIAVKGEKGEQTIQIVNGRDTANWWRPRPNPNAVPGALWKQGRGSTVGAYVAEFELNDLGKLRSVRIAKNPSSDANWIVLGMTISSRRYERPAAEGIKIQAGEEWKVLKRDRSGVHAGTALDLSFLNDGKPTGTYGRVIINKDGHFAFSKNPAIPVRFFSDVVNRHAFLGFWDLKPQLNTHEKIEAYVRQLRRGGYNMVRIHYLDEVLCDGSEEDYDFNPEMLDLFDYLVCELGKNGIYMNWDCMSNRLGYAKGSRWGWKGHPATPGNFGRDLHFSEAIRENWKTGVKKLLTHKNPYTGKTLLEDPTLAVVVGFNEQESTFLRNSRYDEFTPMWQAYLREKYKTVEALKAAWGPSKQVPDDFGKIGIFAAGDQNGASPYSGDVNGFMASIMSDMFRFYKKTLREIGWNGPVAAYNCGKSFRLAIVRKDFDYIAMNGYHAHPSGFTHQNGGHGSIDQNSSIGSAANSARGFFSTRSYGKPYLVTEHLHVFWNKYRYEQGFVTGALSAFQDLDGLSAYGNCVSVDEPAKNSPFRVSMDPIAKAEEFLTAFLFLRGDVSVGKKLVRVALSSKEVMPSGEANDGMSTAQSKIALVSRFAYTADARIPVEPNETVIGRSGGSGLVLDAWYTSLRDGKGGNFNADDYFDRLRKAGFLPRNNRSNDAKGIYETSTGEIRMETKRRYMQVDTPRLQGICAEAGTKARLTDFEVRGMSVRGNIAIVSLNRTPLKDSERMVLVIATNALNDGIIFEDKEMRFLKNIGNTTAIIQTGKFTVALDNKNASDLKAYALSMSGERIAQIPVKAENNKAVISINTAKTPAVFFELATK